MKWLINNKYRNHSDNKYRIKWDRKAPSKGAQIVKDFLFQNCKNHVLFEEYRLPSSRLYCDWIDATLKLCLEYDDKEETGHHNHFNKFFHKTRLGYLNSIKRDIKKEEIERNSSIYTREDVDFANQHGWVMGWEDCKEAVLEIINENLDTKPYNI